MSAMKALTQVHGLYALVCVLISLPQMYKQRDYFIQLNPCICVQYTSMDEQISSAKPPQVQYITFTFTTCATIA